MAIQTYVSALKSSINIPAINAYFVDKRDLTLEILQKVRPEGRVDGDRFKLGSVTGGAGGSFDFNLRTHQWGDWATQNQSSGLLNFLRETLKFSASQVIGWLKENKFFTNVEITKALKSEDGDALVFPIPEETTWDTVIEERVLRKDRGIITGHWEYHDVDGSLLGYKYRIDDRRTSKEVYTLSLRTESGWAKKAWSKTLLPAYGLHKLGASPNIRVLFVEGEKAADKAQEILGERWKVLAFSGTNAAEKTWIPDDEIWESVEVVLWPDNDRAGREAMRQIQIRLDKMRHKPRRVSMVDPTKILSLPDKWDLGDWEEGCGVNVQSELDMAVEVKDFGYIVKDWIYVAQVDLFYNLVDRELRLTTTAFNNFYAAYKEKTLTPHMKFLTDSTTTKVESLDFVPGHGPLLYAKNGMKFFNEWSPNSILLDAKEIADNSRITDEEIAENAKYFIAHIARVCGDEKVEPDKDVKGEIVPGTENRDLVDAFTWHFASLVQRPMDKRGWVPMMVSESNGTGKSYFQRVMAKILGGRNSKTINVQEFTSEYHDWKDNALFYELAETKSHDDTEVYEEIKKLHSYRPFNEEMMEDRSENSEQLNIKSRAKKSQRDFLNGYITSNHLFPIALANKAGKETGDRRLFVIRCEQILTELENEQLFDEELMTRAQWIAAYLLRYKARHKWNPSWAPVTAHKRLMLEEDRVRSEARSEKHDVGGYTKTLAFLKWAIKFQEGCFSRKVYSFNQVKAIVQAEHHNFPYDESKVDNLMKTAGVFKCDHPVKGEKSLEPAYTSDEKFIKAPTEILNAEIKKNTGDVM